MTQHREITVNDLVVEHSLYLIVQQHNINIKSTNNWIFGKHLTQRACLNNLLK